MPATTRLLKLVPVLRQRIISGAYSGSHPPVLSGASMECLQIPSI